MKPTEAEVAARAKELAERDGNNWIDQESRQAAANGDDVPPMTDGAERLEYLSRARRELLSEDAKPMA
jgi:hypothetical protein